MYGYLLLSIYISLLYHNRSTLFFRKEKEMSTPTPTTTTTTIPRSSITFADRLDSYFKITERGSTIGTEIRSGCVTFLTMSYILLVNPQILAQIGIPTSQGGKF